MDFTAAVSSVYRNYATFSGRARRSEFWWFFLFSIIASIGIGIVESALGLGQGSTSSGDGGIEAAYNGGILSILWAIGNFIPALAVAVRRLHDTDRSGWWYLIIFVPLIGIILLIVWWATKGTDGPNRFGEDPIR
jgi:uncharacterized membrane protein YhaH (DUF805 family)